MQQGVGAHSEIIPLKKSPSPQEKAFPDVSALSLQPQRRAREAEVSSPW